MPKSFPQESYFGSIGLLLDCICKGTIKQSSNNSDRNHNPNAERTGAAEEASKLKPDDSSSSPRGSEASPSYPRGLKAAS
ncbi:hypothetical protein GCM10010917_41870 [Paenibacillus physcomitrellae]|uniref:Uncharacterized protein n=1 Tax=Paenibacillus physcomitrellae TaxID=1619311 RepID=A0ABQ1GY69_9BACL|nr:hypothetical protein GCM10010917_41870 [Paenibacillus physcomitrellae]